jgi:hypothetical protein
MLFDETRRDENGAGHLKFILAGCQRMSHLIDALLRYAQAGETHHPGRPDSFRIVAPESD